MPMIRTRPRAGPAGTRGPNPAALLPHTSADTNAAALTDAASQPWLLQ
ncbi:hypothetical protein [Streptacidiphilus melanogenes]|nr:hypothetical protein [Streptacidiphilus melanogenes]